MQSEILWTPQAEEILKKLWPTENTFCLNFTPNFNTVSTVLFITESLELDQEKIEKSEPFPKDFNKKKKKK